LKINTRWAYDLAGRVSSVTDARGQTTNYSYDGWGNLVTVTNPENGKRTMKYNINNAVTSITFVDAAGKTLSNKKLELNIWGDVLSTKTLVNATQTSSQDIVVDYTYNKLGQVIKMFDPK